METLYGGGTLAKFTAVTRVREAGVEKLRLQTQYVVGTEDTDQTHSAWGVIIGAAENCWVREVTGMYFGGGTVAMNSGSIRITVQDCANLDPVSAIIGGRRYSFPINGQLTLVQRCYSRKGRHDFITGYQNVGTNVYLDSLSETTYADSGPHNCWSTGILYDGVKTDQLLVQDRDYLGSGQGWAGANHVLWNCQASIVCQIPPTANNWAIGCKGTKGAPFATVPPRVSGTFDSWLTPVATRSLYLKQLDDRLGSTAVNNITTSAQRAGSLTTALKTRYDEVSPAVQWPNFSVLADQVLNVNTSTAALPFTIGDPQTAATALVVTGASSNTTLVPNARIVFGGSGASRTVTITPALNQIGTSSITIKVSDGALSATRVIALTVTSTNAPPTISTMADVATLQDTATPPISFVIADDVTTPETLTLTGTSSNQSVVPNANIVFTDAWDETDIGNVAADGSSTIGSTIQLNASGADINGMGDEGYLLTQSVTGDTEMIARVLSVENTDPLAKAGVMIRQNSASNSPNAYMHVTPTSGVQFSRRLTAGAATTSTLVAGISAPCWVRLVKTGTNYTGYYATETNGVGGAWVQVGSTVAIPAIPGTCRSGLASTSRSDGTLCTSTYDNVTGSGNRRVTITPAPGVYAKLTITISVSDGQFSTPTSFILRVNSPLSITSAMLSTAADTGLNENSSFTATAVSAVLGSGGSSPYVDSCVVYVFQLPALGVIANPFTETSLTFNYAGKDGTLKRCDLYGLGRRASSTVVASDYYGSNTALDTTDATRLQTGIVTDTLPFGLISTSVSGSTALLNYLNAQYASGAGAGQYVFLRLNTGEIKNGIDRAFVTMFEGGAAGPPDTGPQIVYTAFPANNAPTISAIADQTIPLNSDTGPLAFTISDAQTAASALILSVASSNTTLVPLSGIVIGGSGANRSITVTPAFMQSGTSTVTLSISDGTFTTTETFLVTVDELAFGRFAYLFNQDTNFEGWTANAQTTGAAVTAGSLTATLTAGDPQFNHSAALNILGSDIPTVLVRMKSSAGGNAQLFFSNELSGVSAANSVTIPVTAGSVFKWYAFNVAANANWTGHTIKALRLDPPGSTGTVSIDAIIGSDGDFNQNGVPDIWEVANQLDPTSPADALQDTDGDGITDAAEYVFGTNPGAANTSPSLTPARSGTNLTLTFTATAATGTGYAGLTRFFDVETTTNLADAASWTGVVEYTNVVGANQTVTVTQPLTGGPRFYRLNVRLQ